MGADWTQCSAGIEVATVSSAEEFVEALRPSNPHWWEADVCPWVFRGHARDEWKLLPSAWRPDNSIMENCREEASRRFENTKPEQFLKWIFPPNNFVSGETKFGDDDGNLARRLTIAATAEYIPIWDFATICDELGMPVPLAGAPPDNSQDSSWLAEAPYPLMGDELLRFSDLPTALALAQHHQIPTRLLDWTRNSMAAALFAVEPLNEAETKTETSLVVWALHKRHARDVSVVGVDFPDAPLGTKRFDPSINVFRPLSRDNPFLAAQAGLFTTINFSGIYFMKSGGQRPCLEDFIAEAKPSELVLRKLVLPQEHSGKLIEILRRENISRSALMPTMDNVAKEVQQMWSHQVAKI